MEDMSKETFLIRDSGSIPRGKERGSKSIIHHYVSRTPPLLTRFLLFAIDVGLFIAAPSRLFLAYQTLRSFKPHTRLLLHIRARQDA